MSHAQWTGSNGIDSAFLEMMPDTVTFYAEASKDKYGKSTFSQTATNVKGRVIYQTQKITNEQGEDDVIGGRVYLYGDYSNITVGHKIDLPNGKSPVIKSVENKTDNGGVHHTIVTFGV